jgi:predicted ribosome quality control (RQC) complex YloA/Tae2 family protein
MTTDWILIRRAGEELERALRGGRVTDAGLLDDGRIALRFGGLRKRGPATLAIDAFGSPPVVTLDEAELAVAADPGWLRSVGTALRGMRLTSVRPRRGDRVLVLTFGGSSRFGVESELRLVLELVPRYGNVVLLRDRLVIAAAKQFSPAENEARSVQIGLPYEPPPLPHSGDGSTPQVPRAILAAAAAGDSTTASALLAAAEEAAADADRPVHVYRDSASSIVAAHVVPLAQYASLAHETVPSLLDVFAAARAAALRSQRGDATERRRAALLARIAKRARATDGELASVEARLAGVAERDRLRESGDALFTHAHEIPPGATAYVPPTNPALTIALDPELDAKDNAQRYYARYRKAANALPHLERRREALAARREALDVLAFEAERADAPTLPELEADLDALEGRPPQRTAQSAAKRRAPLRVERPSGARIYVGRSPRENAEVTFRIARPDDLWFHARGIPGSHVVLQPPPGAEPNDDDLSAAADLAATHSKAKHAPRVEIDYTERKYVRKQRDGAPGLVWYTNARTRVGRPSNENDAA